MAELLIELYSEEIPARMQARAGAEFGRLLHAALTDAALEHAEVRTFVTPQRLVAVVDGLPLAQPDVREERRGPKADAPAKAVEGFLTSVGLTLDQVEKRETPKGVFLFATIDKKGRASAEVLPDLIVKAITGLTWPKSMRWGANRFAWVRPLHGVLAVFDGEALQGGLDLGGATLPFVNVARGHRFLAPGRFEVQDFADYAAKLKAARVTLDAAERRETILNGAKALAEKAGLVLRDDEGLLNEVAGLVECPAPLKGRIDDAYMDLPAEVLTTSMRAHQKYFALETADGRLAANFIVVANGAAGDVEKTVVAGNERVLRARLSDARFFWDHDRAQTLESRIEALSARIFHAKLGSDLERVQRLRKLATTISDSVPNAAPALCERAAQLAKADLTTGMVGEFPELQGVMGAYYAQNDGEPAEVVEAIRTHYAPLGPNDACPNAPVSVALALADKLDALAGFWLIGDKPTGSKDPFALRRAALGVIRLIVENGVRVGLRALIDAAAEGHRAQRAFQTPAITDDLMAFFAERLKVRERERGVRHDLIAAVFALAGEDDLVRLLARADALQAFVTTPDGLDLIAAYKRATNIVRIETKKDGAPPEGGPDPATFVQDEERALLAALAETGEKLAPLLEAEAFSDAMAALAGLREPVDAFFERVTVNADDPVLRANRLRLLAAIGATMETVADFSKIEG